ncbi:unnamed protein product [Schistosoma mattheei]|uniref:Uncharacterized protein n=1 Tax=Schistosoma mattheei TaxID=31246 RepID=A0A183NYG6_9TREM|nr:unnamed protein product [Schistosoma mattheei]
MSWNLLRLYGVSSRTNGTQSNCQTMSLSESSLRMSRHFHCMEMKLGEHHQKGTSIRGQLSTKDNKCPLDRYHQQQPTSILSSKTKLLPYVINENGFAVLVEDKFLQNALIDNDILKNQICGDLGRLSEELEEILSEMCSGDRAPLKDKFIEDLRRDRDLYKGQELRERLRVMRRRLDYPGMLSSDVILNLLLSYRQCEDFDAMVTLIEEIRALKLNQDILNVCMIQYLYAFALHRRNKNGDRDAALAVTEEVSRIFEDNTNLLFNVEMKLRNNEHTLSMNNPN